MYIISDIFFALNTAKFVPFIINICSGNRKTKCFVVNITFVGFPEQSNLDGRFKRFLTGDI